MVVAVVCWLGGYFFEGSELCDLSALPGFVHQAIYMGPYHALEVARDLDNEDASS
jgi:hypothetical protein